MKAGPFLVTATFAALLLPGCSSGPPKPGTTAEWHPPYELLEKYADKNGVVTRAAIEAGLKADFVAADKNHDGCLDEDEARAVNEARWKVAASTTSPLIDFLHNGCIDFDEFAAEPRSLFEQLDKKGDGRLTPQELHLGRKPSNQSTP
jgi:Ca2+-binding EF-hand superfamily protein